MRSRLLSICLSIVLLLCAVSGVTAAEIGKLSFADGRVDILKQGMAAAVSADVNASVSAGDIIRTKSNSRAEISLASGTKIRLAQGSRVGISGVGKIDLFRGKIRATADSYSAIEVLTPNASVNGNGTDFYFIHEKGSSWFYAVKGWLQATSREDAGKSLFVEDQSCVRVASHIEIQDSCVFKFIDQQKHAWDTSTSQNIPVVAKLPTSGEVYTYTLLGGRAVDTPSLPVSVAFEDLVCTQCPPLADPPVQAVDTKMGDFERSDDFCPICEPIEPQ